MALRTYLALAAWVAAAPAARAALVLEYVQVSAINAPLSNGPALASFTMAPGEIAFLQITLRDTLGSGPNFGQPGTVPWLTPGGLQTSSLGLGAFFIRFDSVPGVAVNPAPNVGPNATARLVDPVTYGTVLAGTSPPLFSRIGGLLNFGWEPGLVPDPNSQDRIGLFNLRLQALAAGSGTFRLRDPNPTPSSADNALLQDADLGGFPNPGTIIPIDDLIFGPSFTNTYDLPVTVTPEPSSLALLGLAASAFAGLRRKRRGSPAPG